MSELAVYETGAVVQQQEQMQNRAVARLGEWAQSASAAYQVAKSLVGTSFVPAQFRGKPEEATAAILAGAEVGLSPMASLKSFDIISGTAAPRALTLRAIVQSQGHEMVLEESTAERCKMKGRRRGDTEWTRVTWTMDRARGLGLGAKDNWKKQPAAMLVARATGELARLIAADAILGIGYTIEEVADGADVSLGLDQEPEKASNVRVMQRKSKTSEADAAESDAAPPAGDADGESVPAPASASEPRITEKQSKRLHALCNELGLDRDAKLAGIAATIGRTVESSADLTPDEASEVIDSLAAAVAEREASA